MNFTTLKSLSTAIGGILILAGQTIEPELGIWVVSLGGSLLGVTMGEDFTIFRVILNIILAIFMGIFGSQIAFVVYPTLPRLADCFILSLFGVPITYYIIRNLKVTSFAEVLLDVIDRIVPWKGNKK